MSKCTFAGNGNVGFHGLKKPDEPLGRTFVFCQHCKKGDAELKAGKFVCKNCGRESKPRNGCKQTEKPAMAEESLFENSGSIGLV